MKNIILLVVAGVAAAQWLVFAVLYLTSREPHPKRGLRRVETMLLASSAVLAVGFLAQVDVQSLWKPSSATTAASSVATSRGSCASLDSGMSVAEVKQRMGEPDRTVGEEETRGPGAVTLFYAGSRCSVHVFDGRVEFID